MLQALQMENADLKRRLAAAALPSFTHESYAQSPASSSPPAPASSALQPPDHRPPRPITASPPESDDIVMQAQTPTKRAAPGQVTTTGTESTLEKSEPKRLRPADTDDLPLAVPDPPDLRLPLFNDV